MTVDWREIGQQQIASQSVAGSTGPKIYGALLAVMDTVKSVAKTGTAPDIQGGYKFRGIDAILNAVGPALRNAEVCVFPRVLSMKHRDFETKNKALMHEAIVEMEYTFVAKDGTRHSCSAVGEASDTSDKATSQAQSVAYRTMWIQALCLPTGDPEPENSDVTRGTPADEWRAGGWHSAEQRRQAWEDNLALQKEIPEGKRLADLKAWGKAQGFTLDSITANQSVEWLGRIGAATDTQSSGNLTYPEGEEPF